MSDPSQSDLSVLNQIYGNIFLEYHFLSQNCKNQMKANLNQMGEKSLIKFSKCEGSLGWSSFDLWRDIIHFRYELAIRLRDGRSSTPWGLMRVQNPVIRLNSSVRLICFCRH